MSLKESCCLVWMRLEINSKSDNDRDRSKQNSQVISDLLKASKHRRKIVKLKNFLKNSKIKSDDNGNRKYTIVDKIIARWSGGQNSWRYWSEQ